MARKAARSVWLNGSELGGFKGLQGTVTVDLSAGDNILLLKVSSTASGKWGLTFVNVDEIGARVGGRISVVPAEALKDVPALNPAPLPPVMKGELTHPEGVTWRMVYEDAFEEGNLADHWRIASGTWKMGGGVLGGQGAKAFIVYAQALPTPVRIEYDARSPEPGDLSACYLDDPPDFTKGILFGFASNGGTLNKILLEGDQVAESEKPLAQANKWHHVIAQILPDARIQLVVDDQVAVQYQAKNLPIRPRFAGLWTWNTAQFDNVKLYLGG
jgi:hypothetical protein